MFVTRCSISIPRMRLFTAPSLNIHESALYHRWSSVSEVYSSTERTLHMYMSFQFGLGVDSIGSTDPCKYFFFFFSVAVCSEEVAKILEVVHLI